jgi:hypothetical protein
MKEKTTWVILTAAMVMLVNYTVLRIYGDAIRSTNVFIARATVFYPLSWIDLLTAAALIGVFIWRVIRRT